MAKTPNLGLHQWGANDAFLREDFNEDLLKLDKALRCKTGSFQGDGTNNRVIDLGVSAKLVILFGTSLNGQGYISYFATGYTASETVNSLVTDAPSAAYGVLTGQGFQMGSSQSNAMGNKYYYVAFY